ncbi:MULTISPECIES: DUF3084 domain-containing protein [Aminobacterium]|mgnify:CR=1 FL=1|uniref:Uncharacterized protein with the myosin-like protein domain n=1 Tax=Aminobacterium colombiense (strain DSM 12261 / ALA-1) TaxID=572547 RepID=D5EE18_AMICL|nr:MULTISPECIES: DUF3084 domain-containing protein [Aminobacterium]MDD2378654.1 DUF3084 domain-containing protein [Aminobacterium colombiense]ADE56800.1 Uncharacterized protein with the myosin-like protein domain [Aminobacterium colombiense DSM 12261]MDD3767672.1 DUF3084 domain-containing protein [Aminobacterium colombiense]MDD4264956.1 DUF3084 domain-containing protein [Aminobacterium colombiense]MDD4585481.1 DUF3084 domain-containing protein [Aminobacterium colombiense]
MQAQIWSDMNWKLIITLLMVSAILAYFGDRVGMRIGKKRISLFGLRPRHTSQIITAFTGVVISVGILLTMSVVSENVRTALFSMKFLQSQIINLTAELQESRDEAQLASIRLMESQSKLEEQEKKLREIQGQLAKVQPELEKAQKELTGLKGEKDSLKKEKVKLDQEVSRLRQEADHLREGLVQVRSGRIAVFAGELLGQQVVPPGSSQKEVEAIFESLRRRAELMVSLRTGISADTIILDVDLKVERTKIQECVNALERKFIRILAGSNALLGEDVRVRYEVHDSKLVYQKGKVVASRLWQPDAADAADAESFLHDLLAELNQRAVTEGIMPDPASGKIGAMDATHFFETVEILQETRQEVEVVVVVAEDIYTEGPVKIKFEVVPLGDRLQGE